jgi:hypothetical protein
MEIKIIETGEKKSLDPELSDIHKLIYKNPDGGYSMSQDDFNRLEAKSKI